MNNHNLFFIIMDFIKFYCHNHKRTALFITHTLPGANDTIPLPYRMAALYGPPKLIKQGDIQ